MKKETKVLDLRNDAIRATIESCTDAEEIAELFEFGSLMIAEVQARASHIDSKLAAYVAASSALAALLGIGARTSPGYWEKALLIAAIVSSILALATAATGLLSEKWPFPNEHEWVNPSLKGSFNRRRQHVFLMLSTHREWQRILKDKARYLWPAERLILGAAVLSFVLLMVRSSG